MYFNLKYITNHEEPYCQRFTKRSLPIEYKNIQMGLFRKKRKKENTSKKITSKSSNFFYDKADEDTQQDDFFLSEPFDKYQLAIVADGIKSKPNSQFASKQVIDVFKNFFAQINNFESPGVFLHRTVLVAATMLMNKSAQNSDYREIATSLSGFVVKENQYYAINTGNCRVYHFSNNKLTQITKDQTIAQQKADNGEISENDLFNNAENDNVTHFLGTSISDLNSDVIGPFDLKKGDILVASTGGLHFSLKKDEIEKIIVKNKKIGNIATILGITTKQIGSNKNITICSYIH